MIQRLSQLIPKGLLATKEKGFSLVEVILAGSIFILITTTLIGSIIYGQESTVLSGKRVQAVFLAEEGLEVIRNIRDDNFANLIDGTYGLQIIGGQWNIAGASEVIGIFTRQLTISTIDINTKKITVTVTWQQNLQRQGSVSVDTYLTYWLALAGDQGTDLVVDTSASNINIQDNTQIVGLTLENTGLADVIIDQMTVSWTGAPGGTKINNISIDGNSVWSGSGNSGGVLNIASLTLPVGTTIYPINNLDFNRNMTGTTITIDFTLSDLSVTSVTFSPGVTSDVTAPAAISNLTSNNPTSNSIDLSWTAPGDDGSIGTATAYDIRYATSPISEANWATALQLSGEPTPQVAGSSEFVTVTNLSSATAYYFAIKTSDEVPNTSLISNISSATTTSQANSLSVNITGVRVDPTNNKRVIGMTIANSGTASIVLDQMIVSWTGAGGGTKLNSITINTNAVWTGANNSGATENITDFTLSPATTYPITNLTFSKNITGAILSINFIMLDGSTKLISNIIP